MIFTFCGVGVQIICFETGGYRTRARREVGKGTVENKNELKGKKRHSKIVGQC